MARPPRPWRRYAPFLLVGLLLLWPVLFRAGASPGTWSDPNNDGGAVDIESIDFDNDGSTLFYTIHFSGNPDPNTQFDQNNSITFRIDDNDTAGFDKCIILRRNGVGGFNGDVTPINTCSDPNTSLETVTVATSTSGGKLLVDIEAARTAFSTPADNTFDVQVQSLGTAGNGSDVVPNPPKAAEQQPLDIATPTPTASPTPSATPTSSPSPSPTPVGSPSPSPSASASPSPSPSPTPCLPGPPICPTPSPTPSGSPSPSGSPTASPTGSPGPSGSPTASPSGSPGPSGSPTASPSGSPGPSGSPTASPGGSPTPTASPGGSPTPTPVRTPTPTPTSGPTTTGSASGPATARAGSVISVAGDGYGSGAKVDATLASDPVFLGSANADQSGHVQMEVTIPRDTQAGVHELRLTGRNPQGGTRVNTMQIRIVAVAAGLPTTGADATRNIYIAFAILTLGELLIGASMWAERSYARSRSSSR